MSRMTRRDFSLGCMTAGLAAGLWAAPGGAAVSLDPSDPSAKALGFVADARAVDTAAYPSFKPLQKCANCAQFQGKTADPSAPCTIFAGKSVPSAGWCKVWVQRPGG